MTKRKLTLIIVSSVIAALLIAVAICAIIANSKNDKSTPTQELASWQGMIRDEALLKNIATPGAHDAGTKGLPYFAATQDRSIADMLLCGTRYFDLRVSYAKGKLLIYHGPSKGVSLQSVLQDVRDFMQTHPTETVILDFQHFDEKDTEAQDGSLQLVETLLGDIVIKNTSNKSDVDFIDELTLGEARAKCLIVWGRETDGILAKNYVFKRNNDNGTRKDSVIQSYYIGSLNKKSSKVYIKSALPTYIGKYKDEGKGLFVLQGQLTDGLFVFGPHLREATHTDNMDEYVDSLKQSDDLSVINIIMRDFVTPSKNCRILKLNLTKNLVKNDSVANYGKMITDKVK